MVSRKEFDLGMGSAKSPLDRVSTFGALLTKAAGRKSNVYIVGGSAITVWLGGRYVSEDIDVVGHRSRIVPVLERWGFVKEADPDGREYWTRSDLRLFVDVLHRERGSGRGGVPMRYKTAFGPVYVSAVEDLIVRRLVFWSRSGRREALDQAAALYARHLRDVDRGYLEAEVHYERVETAYAEMRKIASEIQTRPE